MLALLIGLLPTPRPQTLSASYLTFWISQFSRLDLIQLLMKAEQKAVDLSQAAG